MDKGNLKKNRAKKDQWETFRHNALYLDLTFWGD